MQNSSAFQYLAIDTIRESTTTPRRTFDEGKLHELAESLEVIQRTSALILSAIETPAAAEQSEAEADPEPTLAQAS